MCTSTVFSYCFSVYCLVSKDLQVQIVLVDKKFSYKFNLLHKICGMSKTLNIHIREDHVSEYIKLTNKPLGHRTDQTTEAAHQYLNKRIRKSNYYVPDVESEAHGQKLFRAILHLNSYNI